MEVSWFDGGPGSRRARRSPGAASALRTGAGPTRPDEALSRYGILIL
ncbi:hypothetical protein SFR_0928 [Streptomyces sp. FR-008]|nr:hypothetical protein SFR_0928 [Streptomyces sp. FR-008]